MVTCTSTNTCYSVAIKNLVKIVKYLEFVQFYCKITPLLPVILYIAVYVNIMSYLYYVLYKQVTLYDYFYGLLKNRTCAETTRTTANSTHTNVNGCYWNTSKHVFTITRTRIPGLVLMSM